jgi:N6-adenosine-specific RNA methylase IME4
VWQEENLLLDGHNRFEICKRYGMEYELFFVSLPDRQHAINWIINNQLGRRNVTPEQASYLRGKRYNMEPKSPGERNDLTSDHFDPRLPVADRLAEEFKVSPATIKRDGKFAAAVDTLADTIGDEARTAVLSGNSKVTKQDVTDAAEWYKSNPGGRLTIEQEAEELAGDDSAYNWTEDEKSEAPILVANTEKEILEAAKRIRQEKLDQRREERAEKIIEISQNNKPLSATDLDRLYPVVYADPPWRYEHSMTDNRKIENQYPTMTLEEICNLPVGDIAAPDAVLLLWTTSPKLAESMDVINAWGFVYRTCIVWDKERIGMGYYARQQHELLLIASRGSIPVPEPENRPASVIRLKRDNEHSAKPHEFYTLIERMYPEYDRIELFARNNRDGWAAWGNQA